MTKPIKIQKNESGAQKVKDSKTLTVRQQNIPNASPPSTSSPSRAVQVGGRAKVTFIVPSKRQWVKKSQQDENSHSKTEFKPKLEEKKQEEKKEEEEIEDGEIVEDSKLVQARKLFQNVMVKNKKQIDTVPRRRAPKKKNEVKPSIEFNSPFKMIIEEEDLFEDKSATDFPCFDTKYVFSDHFKVASNNEDPMINGGLPKDDFAIFLL